jgi:hydroxyacylglutathione hydrolase
VRATPYLIEGLGHLSTVLVDDATGSAAVVDPRRDVDVYLDAARDAAVRITHIVETHLHNDYVSGGRELAALTGATHVIGAGAELAYEHRALRDGETFDVGGLRFTVLDTPGHTPEHVSYAVADTSRAEEPALLFTGGSLLVGAVGRTDLLGADHARAYAADQHRSLHDVLLRHEDSVAVHPTHGAGSLCAAGIAPTPWSTIGYERRNNDYLRHRDAEAFVTALLAGQPAVPSYFARMRPLNQAGATLLGGRVPEPRPLRVDEVDAAVRRDALVVDLRTPAAHAAGHIPGSLSIPAGSSFGTWLGWTVPHDRPLVLVLDDPAAWDDAVRQLLRIGHEPVLGYLRGGLRAWADAGQAVEPGASLTVAQLERTLGGSQVERPLVIDVRQPSEYDAGHVPGSVHIGAGDLPNRLAELPHDRPLVTICASGYRSSVAASLLRQAGFRDVSWVADGVPAWEACGGPIERGGATREDEREATPTGAAHAH